MNLDLKSIPDYFICDTCYTGFREDARHVFEEIGKVRHGTYPPVCTCGGTYQCRSAEDSIGYGGVMDMLSRRKNGYLPS